MREGYAARWVVGIDAWLHGFMASWLQAWGNEGGICSKGVSMDGKLGSGDECMVSYIMDAWLQVWELKCPGC